MQTSGPFSVQHATFEQHRARRLFAQWKIRADTCVRFSIGKWSLSFLTCVYICERVRVNVEIIRTRLKVWNFLIDVLVKYVLGNFESSLTDLMRENCNYKRHFKWKWTNETKRKWQSSCHFFLFYRVLITDIELYIKIIAIYHSDFSIFFFFIVTRKKNSEKWTILFYFFSLKTQSTSC